jgi:aminopeptidase N
LKNSVLTILASLFIAAVSADQSEFDQRQEQQLRPHDFDVQHYRIALTLDESSNSFSGETEITLTSTADGTRQITLDREHFDVRSVTNEAGRALDFVQGKGHLDISLDRALAQGEMTKLTVSYQAKNLAGNTMVGLDFRDKTETNPEVVNSLNWPDGARYWIPSFDHPSDWATHETIVTVNADFRVLSNGALVSDQVNPVTGLRTVHWSQDKPQPTYLYMFAAGPYSVLEDQLRDLPLHYWVYPADEDVAAEAFSKTPEIIAFFEQLYGSQFPWVKYDQVIVPGMPGGAESTSATLLTRNVIDVERAGTPGASDWLIAHEVAHQWWGNLIGFRDWGHNWLSESFATHGEHLYIAHALGPDEGALYLEAYKEAYLTEADTKYQRPVVTNQWNHGRDMFDHHAYEKGGIILNMLRELIGYGEFGEVMRVFLQQHAYQNVVSADFFATVNSVTNDDYDWFFEQWLMKPGHPVLDVSHSWDEQEKILSLTVEQRRDPNSGTPVYRLPIKLGITTRDGKKIESFWLTEDVQTFTFEVSSKPLMVHFDEGDILLKEWAFNKQTDELIYQANYDGVIGRLWAVGELEKRKSESDVRAALELVSNTDADKAVRERAAKAVLAD